MLRIVSFISITLLATTAYAEIAGRASVIDGDTIEIHGQRIRLHGVDAPEKNQPCYDSVGRAYRCGTISARALDQFIDRGLVICRERATDRYGRTIALCSVRGKDIEEWLVRSGHALAYRRYSSEYIGAEQEAKNARRGVWTGSLTPPWEWRRQQREPPN